jgi:hypothetical protein
MTCCSTGLISDEITVIRNGQTTELYGNIVVEAHDDSLLFRGRDGQLLILQPDEIQNRKVDDADVEPLSRKELGEQMLNELPPGFKIHQAGQFVIAYQTEKAYARWVGGLYTRLFRGFNTYWTKKKKFKLEKPEFPLGVIIFASREQYAHFVNRELGIDPGTMVAYYNLMTNRVAMYDLTADQQSASRETDDDRRITEILGQPAAIPMVATVIHEGTHQLIFNTGMQTRFSDTPLWLNEGLAMFFETPDLTSSTGWRAIGNVNPMRLHHLRANLELRDPDALRKILSSDDVFRDPATKLLAYSEAWALNYFLLNEHSDSFIEYLKHMSQKAPQQFDGPDKRLAEFKQFLGDDLDALDREFIQYVRKLSN